MLPLRQAISQVSWEFWPVHVHTPRYKAFIAYTAKAQIQGLPETENGDHKRIIRR